MRPFTTVFLVLAALFSNFHAEARPCRECKKIEALKASYEKSAQEPEFKHDDVANQITQILASAKKQADGKIDPRLADAVISILRVEKDHWFRQLMVEKNATLFSDNIELFTERLKKLPAKEAEEIKHDIDVTLRELKSGNDPKN